MTKINNWWQDIKKIWKQLIIALILLVVSLIAYGSSGDFVSDRAYPRNVPDLILNHFGPYNLDTIFVWGYILVLAVFFAYPLVFRPKKLPYTLSIFGLFLLVRSGFIMFTHLGVPFDAITVTFPSIFQPLNFTNDLFFSGHVGLSFLGFLIFRRENKKLSNFMLIASIILGITVLAMHVHYSIDVFSAYFITYGIYEIGERTFKKMR
jgi:hypothetical protein